MTPRAPLAPPPAPAPPARPAAGVPRRAETDAQLLELWLFGRSPHTQRAYRREIARFLAHPALAGKALRTVTPGDVQAFAAALAAEDAGLQPASQARALAAVKSLLAFGHRLGYLPFDVGGATRLLKLRQGLAERILSEAEVHRLLALEPDPRNRALLRLSYAGGLRVSELVAPRWRDLQPRGEGEGQVTVYGKGGKTRTVLLPAPVWTDLLALRETAVPGAVAADGDAPVFRSRKGGGAQGLRVRQAQRLVDAAARRAGLRAGVSPHWLRHAHATHALGGDGGVGRPLGIVQRPAPPRATCGMVRLAVRADHSPGRRRRRQAAQDDVVLSGARLPPILAVVGIPHTADRPGRGCSRHGSDRLNRRRSPH